MSGEDWSDLHSLTLASHAHANSAARSTVVSRRRASASPLPRCLAFAWTVLAFTALLLQRVSAAPSPQQAPSAAAPALADPIFSVDDLSNYTALAPGPADATSHALQIPPLTTNVSEAEAWFRRLLPQDASGRTVICYGVYRFYAADIAEIGPSVVELLLQGLGSVLDAVQLSFHASYAVLQQPPDSSSSLQAAPAPPAEPAAAPPAASSAGSEAAGLSAYNSMDLYFSMAVQKDATLKIPLDGDLLDLTRAFLTSRLRSAGYGHVGSLFMDLAFPAGFTNAQRSFIKETFYSTLVIMGEDLLPFTTQKQTRVMAALADTLQESSSSARTAAIVPTVSINPAEAVISPPPAAATAAAAVQPLQAPAPEQHSQPPPPPQPPGSGSAHRRLLARGSPPAHTRQQLHIIIRSRMYPVQLVTVSELWRRALVDGAFEEECREFGFNASLTFINSTIDTTSVPGGGRNATVHVTVSTRDASANGTQALMVPAAAESTAPSSRSSGLGKGAQAAIAVACIAGVCVVLAAVLLGMRHRRQRGDTLPAKPAASDSSSYGKDSSSSRQELTPLPSVTSPFARQHSLLLNSEGTQALALVNSSPAKPVSTQGPSSPASVLTVAEAAAAAANARSRKLSSGSAGSLGLTPALSNLSNLSTGSSSVNSGIVRLSISQDVDISELEVCHRDDGAPWVLGRGSFGTVFKALRRGVQEVAIKKIDRGGMDTAWLRMLHKEIAILSKVSFDRNIVQYYGACLNDTLHPILVMEYMAGGDLRQALAADEEGAFAWDARGRGVALDIARGLHFLHSSGVVHRDLKSSNVLLSAEGVAKLADVGLATVVTNEDQTLDSVTPGTWAFAAPELILGLRVTDKADMFSFGVVLWELATREPARRGMLRQVEVPRECPLEVSILIDECLSPEPAARPCAAVAVRRLLATVPGDKPPSRFSRFSSVTC